jgi:hypothetical protein
MNLYKDSKCVNVLTQYSLNFCLELSIKNKTVLLPFSDFIESLEDFIGLIYVINMEN